jgi:hypothetical protein
MPPAPGWWQASDGNWYAPELHPSVTEAAAPPAVELPDLADLGDLADLAELAELASSAAADTGGAVPSQPIDEPAVSENPAAGDDPGEGSVAAEAGGSISAVGGVTAGERSAPDPDEWLMKGSRSKGGKPWRRRRGS